MLGITRSPLTSPALRSVISATSSISFPFHRDHAVHASPLSRLPNTQLSMASGPDSPGIPTSPIVPGSPMFGEYFNLGAHPSSPFNTVHNTTPVSTPELDRDMTPREVDHGKISKSADFAKATQSKDSTFGSRMRPRPSFKLDLPRPGIMRDDSFEAVALAGVTFIPGTPNDLPWSDSFDSVMTLKPTKGRIATPYPRMEDGEWIEDVDVAIREDLETRLSKLV